ncbi:MAG: TIGR02234 family membrane protein [Corynebacterium sp.]|nr:TIGR02234 family membrane protein [Corynebacterium sp.]
MKKIIILIGLAIMWASTRMTWLTATVADDKTGDAVHAIKGASWSTEITAAVAIGLLAFLGSFIIRRPAMIIGALVAIGASWWPLGLLAGKPDGARAQNLLQSQISDWAEVSQLSVNHQGPILALIGCAITLIGCVIVAAQKTTKKSKVKSSAYEQSAVRASKIEEELKENPDSGRVLWDALDHDIDPTEITNADK